MSAKQSSTAPDFQCLCHEFTCLFPRSYWKTYILNSQPSLSHHFASANIVCVNKLQTAACMINSWNAQGKRNLLRGAGHPALHGSAAEGWSPANRVGRELPRLRGCAGRAPGAARGVSPAEGSDRQKLSGLPRSTTRAGATAGLGKKFLHTHAQSLIM